MEENYAPKEETKKNLEILLTGSDPQVFYYFLHDIDRFFIESIYPEESLIKEYVEEIFDYLPLDSSDSCKAHLEVLNRMRKIPNVSRDVLLGGLRCFFLKAYDSCFFEEACRILGSEYGLKDNEDNCRIFEVLEEAVSLNISKDKRDFVSMNRRLDFLSLLYLTGSNSGNEDYSEKSRIYLKEHDLLEKEIALAKELFD